MWALLVVSAIYGLAFMFGVTGNLWVMASMIRNRVCRPPNQRPLNRRERSRVFVFALAVADFVVLLTIPFSLYQNLKVNWPFGLLLCKLHGAIDSSGKFFSVVILTSMSIERYLLVCTKWRYMSSPTLATVIPLSVGVVACVVVPIVPQVIYTTVVEFEGEAEQSTRICLLSMRPDLLPLYINYTFMVGFGLPLSVMTFCYIQLVQHVRMKFRKPKNGRGHRPNYMCGVTRSICRIAVFHFSCWAPFWFFTLAPILSENVGWRTYHETAWFQEGRLFANMLPYINSAGNCILYAFLNADVRKHIIWRPASSQSRSNMGFPSVSVSFNQSPAC